MIVYRIANEKYAHDLSGNGAALYGARWNSKNHKMVYTSSYISLCILESLVHYNKNTIPAKQYLIEIHVPDQKEIKEISYQKIKKNWTQEVEYTQWIGDQFVENNQNLIMKVPSVIVFQENNFLLNPNHPEFKKVKILSANLLQLDKRLQVSI